VETPDRDVAVQSARSAGWRADAIAVDLPDVCPQCLEKLRNGHAPIPNLIMCFLFVLCVIAPLRETKAINAVNAPIEVKPDAVAHVEKGAVQATVTGNLTSDVSAGAVQATVQPGAMVATATFQQPLLNFPPVNVTAPMGVSEGAVQAPVTFSTDSVAHVEKGAVTFEVSPGAIVIHAEGLASGMEKPMAEVSQTVKAAYEDGRNYILIGSAVAVGLIVVIALVNHFHHVRYAALLKSGDL
jgi:hypothetical protein